VTYVRAKQTPQESALRSMKRRTTSLLAVLAIGLGLVGIFPSMASASPVDITSYAQLGAGSVTSVTSDPWPAASNSSTVTITMTGMHDAQTNAPSDGAPYAGASMCGNFLSDGVTPITNLAVADCDGAAQVAHIVLFTATNGTATFNYTLRSGVGTGGIGNNHVLCLPGGLIPCMMKAGDAASSGAGFAITFPVFGGPPPPTLSITEGAARPGATLHFTGANFNLNASVASAQLCDTDGTSNCASLTGVTGSTDGLGALSGGTGVIPAGATTGTRRLVVTDDGANPLSASATVIVLGQPTITLTPSTGGAGTQVAVSGSSFNPNLATVVLAVVDPTNQANYRLAGSGTTDSSGVLHGASLTILASDLNNAHDVGFGVPQLAVVASEPVPSPDPTTQVGSALFTVSSNECTASTFTTPVGFCKLDQTVIQQVDGTDLSMHMTQTGTNPNETTVNMSTITLDGTTQTSTGDLNTVGVVDARGTLSGWSLTGVVTDLVNGLTPDANHTILASKVSWTPVCTATDANQAEVAAGTAGSIPTNDLLCSAASGGGGGSYDADAAIQVEVAASKAAGTYTGTLTLTLTGS